MSTAGSAPAASAAQAATLWRRHELSFTSARAYANAPQEATLDVTFTAPSGREITVPGFWDGERAWKARFAPDEIGQWTWRSACGDAANEGLHARQGALRVGAPTGDGGFERHGPLRPGLDRRRLAHADGTPFLFLADTCWNGPLAATIEDWRRFLETRRRQGFTAIQWVATHWFVGPEGDRDGRRAYRDERRIDIDAAFFQRIERFHDAIIAAGMLSVPVMLWAATWGDQPRFASNPGVCLADDQMALLARYQVARWGADPVAWIINGDGDYRGDRAERWRRLGRRVFAERTRAPVAVHPCGMTWVGEEFGAEEWCDVVGYQSGHGDSGDTVRWLVEGPPARAWQRMPARAVINLEPPYEDHVAYQSRQPISAFTARRALWWSLLLAPTAGVTYGGHGVWGWDAGGAEPAAHAGTGIAKPWHEAMEMPAARQVAHIAAHLGALRWWTLSPCPELLARQPGAERVGAWQAAARSPAGDLALVYAPTGGEIALRIELLRAGLRATWRNPRDDETREARAEARGGELRFTAPDDQDWLLALAERG